MPTEAFRANLSLSGLLCAYPVFSSLSKRHNCTHNDFVGLDVTKAITLYCNNNATIANTKETASQKRTKNIDRKYHIIKVAVTEEIVDVVKVTLEDNLTDSFTKTLVATSFEKHVED
ncbi:hypothetical protein J1N35_007715, partial [Gossypium stocksii]